MAIPEFQGFLLLLQYQRLQIPVPKEGFSLGNIGGLVFFALLAVTLILFIRGKKKKEN